MYVNERTGYDVLTDPYQGEFGSFADPADDSRVSMDDGGVVGSPDVGSLLSAAIAAAGTTPAALGVKLFGCLTGSDTAECVWRELKAIILASPQATTILEYIRTADCMTVLTALGVDSSLATVPCMAAGGVWSAFQAKVATELGIETGVVSRSNAEQYEDDYARGRDRTDAEGGGHTLVNAEGNERAVHCPGYVQRIVRDAAGNVSVYSMEIPKDYPPGTRCPQDVPGVVRRDGVTPVEVPREGDASKASGRKLTIVAYRPTVVMTKGGIPFVTKSGAGNEGASVAKPWYTNKWLWIGAGVVTVLGVATYAYSRRGA